MNQMSEHYPGFSVNRSLAIDVISSLDITQVSHLP
jgi:hypothetical protein